MLDSPALQRRRRPQSNAAKISPNGLRLAETEITTRPRGQTRRRREPGRRRGTAVELRRGGLPDPLHARAAEELRGAVGEDVLALEELRDGQIVVPDRILGFTSAVSADFLEPWRAGPVLLKRVAKARSPLGSSDASASVRAAVKTPPVGLSAGAAAAGAAGVARAAKKSSASSSNPATSSSVDSACAVDGLLDGHAAETSRGDAAAADVPRRRVAATPRPFSTPA